MWWKNSYPENYRLPLDSETGQVYLVIEEEGYTAGWYTGSDPAEIFDLFSERRDAGRIELSAQPPEDRPYRAVETGDNLETSEILKDPDDEIKRIKVTDGNLTVELRKNDDNSYHLEISGRGHQPEELELYLRGDPLLGVTGNVSAIDAVKLLENDTDE